MSPSQRVIALEKHEWQYTDDRRHVVCATCGSKHTSHRYEHAPGGKVPHRKGCHYALIVVEATLIAMRAVEEAPPH